MKRRIYRTILIIASVIFSTLLLYDWVYVGTFVIGRGNWLPSFLTYVGPIIIVLAWFRYLGTDKRK